MRELKEKIVWYDFVSPTEEDIKFIGQRFKVHPVILDELKQASARPKVEIHDGYLYLVVHFPFFESAKKTSRPVEIDIIATKEAVATIRYEETEVMTQFAASCQGIPGFKDNCLGETTGHFIYRLFEYLFEYATRELRHINEKISSIEEHIFAGREREMISEISYVKRDILDFRRIMHPLEGIIDSLAAKGRKFYGQELEVYFTDLAGDYERIWDLVENYKDTIEALESTNQTLVSSRIDDVMRLLAVIAFLLAPFTVIGGLFQMNARNAPIVGGQFDWWILFGLMVAGSVLLYLFFRRKKWL